MELDGKIKDQMSNLKEGNPEDRQKQGLLCTSPNLKCTYIIRRLFIALVRVSYKLTEMSDELRILAIP